MLYWAGLQNNEECAILEQGVVALKREALAHHVGGRTEPRNLVLRIEASKAGENEEEEVGEGEPMEKDWTRNDAMEFSE